MNLLIFFVLYLISRFFDSLRTIIMQKSIHYRSIIQKIHPSCEETDEEKTVRLRFVPWLQHATTSLQHETLLARGGGSRIDALLRRAHRYTHVPSVFLRIYIHLWQASWLSNLVGFVEASSFFSFFFFRTYLLSPLQNRPCAFSRPLLIIRNFFSKNLKISSSAVFDTIVRKMSHIPVGEKLVEKL